MDVKDLMGVVVEELYAGLTGGSADLPLPPRTTINWLQPGLPLHESFFDFAIAGPFAGPTPANLDDFEKLVLTLQRGGDGTNLERFCRSALLAERRRQDRHDVGTKRHIGGQFEPTSQEPHGLVDSVRIVGRSPKGRESFRPSTARG